MAHRFVPAVIRTSVVALVLAGAAGNAAAVVPTTPAGCVEYDENCGSTGDEIGVVCGDGDHGAPKLISNITFGHGVVSAELTSCTGDHTTVITGDADLCTVDGGVFNDNVCNVELTLEAPIVECPDAPDDTCTSFAEASAKLTDKDDGGKDKLLWKLSDGPSFVLGDYGNPTNGYNSYALCGYIDGVLQIEAFAHADSLQWKQIKQKAYSYKGRKGDPSGIKKIKLNAGDAASISVLRKGVALPAPGGSLQIQLIDSAGHCFTGVL